jgi:glycerophosphoryl diester phosphodiesterase
MPENTIPAFQYAIEHGVDALEMDIAVTKDNVIVISHDPILEAPICTGPSARAVIHELTLAEVRQWDCGAVRNPFFTLQRGLAAPPSPGVVSCVSQRPLLIRLKRYFVFDGPAVRLAMCR